MTLSNRKKIQIVEGDPDMLFILGKVLNDAGYSVIKSQVASSIVEGNDQAPDLFILDKDLPLIDGLAVSKFLKVNAKTKQVPIIMISAQPIANRAKHAGVNEFITKPFKTNLLLAAINKCLN